MRVLIRCQCSCGWSIVEPTHVLRCSECGCACCPACAVSLESMAHCPDCAKALLDVSGNEPMKFVVDGPATTGAVARK